MPPPPVARWAGRRWVAVLVAALLLSAGWLGWRAVQARAALDEARSTLRSVELQQGSWEQLEGAQVAASADLRRARTAVEDPVWRAAAAIPVLGNSFEVVRGATLITSDVVDRALPRLLSSARALDEGELLAGGRVDLALLTRMGDDVAAAHTLVAEADARTAALPQNLLPPPVRRARTSLLEEVRRMDEDLGSASRGLALAPAMLGQDGPRRYFLAVQNNAEARGPGGLVGAYAVIRADGGRLSLERTGTNLDFKDAPSPVVDLGPEFSARYDRDAARRSWSSAVLTPDWPSAARIMAGLWQVQGGGALDGVIGIDPLFMAEVLAVTGPARVGPLAVGAENVVEFVMRDEYAVFDTNEERKQALPTLAKSLYEQVARGGYSASAMLTALTRSGRSGHLQALFARPVEQELVAGSRASGALGVQAGDYLHVVSNNAAGNKADYYVRRRVGYVRTGRGSATATVTLQNTVQAQVVPPIVVGRVDRPRRPVEAGQTRQLLSIYVGRGQTVRRVLVDGKEVGADLGSERGHGVATLLVEIRRSRPTVVTAEVTDSGGFLTYRQQPLVVDDELDISVPYAVG